MNEEGVQPVKPAASPQLSVEEADGGDAGELSELQYMNVENKSTNRLTAQHDLHTGTITTSFRPVRGAWWRSLSIVAFDPF